MINLFDELSELLVTESKLFPMKKICLLPFPPY